jgi:hypothetical protein
MITVHKFNDGHDACIILSAYLDQIFIDEDECDRVLAELTEAVQWLKQQRYLSKETSNDCLEAENEL